VLSIRVRIGEFSGVEPDLLASAYRDLVHGTSLCDAALDVVRVPLEGICDECGRRFLIERFSFYCDRCGSGRIALVGGEEMLLDAVTLEESYEDEQESSHRDTCRHSVSA
jgi:hydrogenase nickel incorporation protein HypA/HybF